MSVIRRDSLTSLCTRALTCYKSCSCMVWPHALLEEMCLLKLASGSAADTLTSGTRGPLHHPPCPARCSLQLAAVAFCSPVFRLDSQTAGVPAQSLPSHQLILSLTTLELTHYTPLRWVVFQNFSLPSSLPTHPFSTQTCVLTGRWTGNKEEVEEDANGQALCMNYWIKIFAPHHRSHI